MDDILVVMVEDEADFREPVLRFLSKRGMTVRGVGSIRALEALLVAESPDVILLDVGLPGENGLSAVRRLRELTDAGLVMLTARADTDSRVKGRLDGADEYLSKPVDLRELEAVILALRRRLGGSEKEEDAVWEVDPTGWRLTAPNGRAVSLSSAQWAVVDCLTQRPGEPVDRNALFAAVGLDTRETEDRRLDILVSRLRQKLVEGAGGKDAPIRTVRGVGYVFAASVRRLDRSS